GGNLHVRIWRGAGLRKWLGLLYNRSASAAVWPLTARRAGARRMVRWLAAGAVTLVLVQYVAGFVFLKMTRGDASEASPLTIVKYAYYYGDRPGIRHQLEGSNAVALGVLSLSALAMLLPRRRSLHGDARFASRGEIRSAGLLGSEGIILGRVGGRCLML